MNSEREVRLRDVWNLSETDTPVSCHRLLTRVIVFIPVLPLDYSFNGTKKNHIVLKTIFVAQLFLTPGQVILCVAWYYKCCFQIILYRWMCPSSYLAPREASESGVS